MSGRSRTVPRPKVHTRCPADDYAISGTRVVEVARAGDKPGCLVALYEDGEHLHVHVYSESGSVITSAEGGLVGPAWDFVASIARDGCATRTIKYINTGEAINHTCVEEDKVREDWCLGCEAVELARAHHIGVPQLTVPPEFDY